MGRKKNDGFVYAPFTPEQIESLNRYQPSGVFHPFTCGGDMCLGKWQIYCQHGKNVNSEGCAICEAASDDSGYVRKPPIATGDILIATEAGLECPSCDYMQGWAWSWMADNSWRGQGKAYE